MLFVNIDMSDLADLGMIPAAEKKAVQEAAQNLAIMTKAKITDLAGQKLKSRRSMFVEGLKIQEVDANTYIISLDAKVRWIDDGLKPFNIAEKLLQGNKVKYTKDKNGNIKRYVVVPFEHGPGKGPTNSTPAQQDLTSTIQKAMKNQNIPYGKLELGADGAPKIGKLHSFNIMDKPIKIHEGPGQGKGPIGAVRQGPTGIPFLQNVNVYQRGVFDKQGQAHVKKFIMTFRIAHEDHIAQGRWQHPGLPPMNIMQEGLEWAVREWEQNVAPHILGRVVATINERR